MRICMTILAAALLAAGCATSGGGGAAGDFASQDISAHSRVVMTVHGLSCPLCSHNIDGVLKQLDDVEEVAVDLSTGEVVVDLAAGHSVSAAQLAAAVGDAGFTVKSIRGE